MENCIVAYQLTMLQYPGPFIFLSPGRATTRWTKKLNSKNCWCHSRIPSVITFICANDQERRGKFSIYIQSIGLIIMYNHKYNIYIIYIIIYNIKFTTLFAFFDFDIWILSRQRLARHSFGIVFFKMSDKKFYFCTRLNPYFTVGEFDDILLATCFIANDQSDPQNPYSSTCFEQVVPSCEDVVFF